MRRIVLKWLSALIFAIIVVVVIAFNAGLVWVATGPRNLAPVLPYIEKSLNGENNDFVVKVHEGMLIWDGWKHPLDIRLRGVDVMTRDNTRFSSFPQISLSIDVFALLIGRVEPTALRFKQPIISLFQDENGEVTFGFKQDNAPAPIPAPSSDSPEVITNKVQQDIFPAVIAAFASGQNSGILRSIRLISVEDAQLSIGNVRQGVILNASHVNMRLRRHRNALKGAEFHINAQIDQPDQDGPAFIGLDARQIPAQKQVHASLRVENLWPEAFAKIMSGSSAEFVQALHLPLSANGDMTVDTSGVPLDGHVSIQSDKGALVSSHLAETIPVQKLILQSHVEQKTLMVDHFSAVLGGPVLEGEAQISFQPDYTIQGTVELKQASLANVKQFWPPDLAPMSRSWVMDNIKSGEVPNTVVKVVLQKGDFDLPELPEGALDAKIGFTHARIQFLDTQPPVTEAEGVVHVNAKMLEAQVKSGLFLENTKLSEGNVLIDDLNVENPLITVKFHTDTTAQDVVKFLSKPPVQKAEGLKLDVNTVKGSVSGDAVVSFSYIAPRDKNGRPLPDMGIKYDVKAKMSQAAQPGFLGKFDIQNLNGEATVNNQELQVKGAGVVNGAVADGMVRYVFEPVHGVDTFIDVNARAPVTVLPRFGYPPLSFLSGTLGVKASVQEGPGVEQIAATVDLKDAGLDWTGMHWQKPPGKAATLTLKAEQKNGALAISAFDYASADEQARGNADFSKDLSRVARVHADPFRLGSNNMAVDYEEITGGYTINAVGDTGDARPWTEGSNSHTFSFKNFPAISISAKLKNLILGEERTIKNVAGSIHCSIEFCSDADITGVAGKPFHFRMGQEAKGRTVTLSAEDAGAFLKAAGVYDNMHGGVLALNAVYDDAKTTRPLAGAFTVTEHRITSAPVLARLLNLASLTGFVDTLQGNGITFEQLTAPFVLESDVITLDRARTHGPAIGLSAEGTITFPSQTLNLKGTIVPSYTINSVLRHVPLVGDMLTGGGEGVFGARYSMTGPVGNPDVSVNPLSILTPGFLRGIFDIFDQDPPAADAVTDAAKTDMSKKTSVRAVREAPKVPAKPGFR